MADKQESALTQQSDCKWVRALDSNGNSILISREDLASVVGELLDTQKLYPFMYQGFINLSKVEDLSPLDTIVKMGIYGIKPPTGSWFSLIVYSSFGGTGSDFQIILKDNNIQARIRTTNDPSYKWTDWMKLNN